MLSLILLGASSGLCWGTADFLGGLQSRKLPVLSVLIWSQLAGAMLMVIALIATAQRPVVESIAWGVVAGLFGGVALLCFYRGLAVGAMSVVAPISACGAVVPVLVALATRHVPGPVTGAGMAVAIAGIVLVSLRQDAALHPAGRPGLALTLALCAACGFGLFYVFLHQGSQGAGSPLWAVAGARGGSLLMLLILVAGRGGVVWPGRRMPLVVLVGVLDTTANLLFAYASIQGNFGVAAVLGSLYPISTVILGRLVLKERLGGMQNAGVGLALAGVALLSAGGG